MPLYLQSEPTVVVQDFDWDEDVFCEAVAPRAKDILRHSCERLSRGPSKQWHRMLTLLEAYLQVTSNTLDVDTFASPSFRALCRGFVGAIYTHSFWTATYQTQYKYHRLWNDILQGVHSDGYEISYFPTQPTTLLFISLDLGSCIKEFQAMPCSNEAVEMWKGWPVINLNEQLRWIHLQSLRKLLGAEFVSRFFEVSDTWFSNCTENSVHHINLLARFICNQRIESPAVFLDAQFSQTFWRDFLDFYLDSSLKTTTIDVAVKAWRGKIKRFLLEHLFPSGLFIEPETFPKPPSRKIVHETHHLAVNENGLVQTNKLLTSIPLKLNQQQALDILFANIQRDVDIVLRYAEAERKKIFSNFMIRKSWQDSLPFSEDRCVADNNVSSNERRILHDAAIALKQLGGYISSLEDRRLVENLVNGNGPLISQGLGLPVTNALLPHVTILVHEHPQITTSFLEKLVIFDSKDKQINPIKDDSGWVLRGVKPRKHKKEAEQHVVLNARSLKVVEEILMLTEAPRLYMRKHNLQGRHHLLLTTGEGFGVPRPVRSLSSCTSEPGRRESTAELLALHSDISIEEARDLSDRFSLATLRSSMGTLKYIETGSGEKMAKELGHTKYNKNLLSRYLPAPIRTFLQTRYVRIMQTGIIVEAMKDSPNLLRVTPFATMDELHAFLNTHTLRFTGSKTKATLLGDPADHVSVEEWHISRIVFNININVLTIYASLELALKKATGGFSGRANYWSKIGLRVMAFIEERASSEPTHAQMLAQAREKASVTYIEAALNE
jgi:hypothetical protein